MAAKNQRPIIIVKRKKRGVEAHHGGAWKVAYADFVTAMMAFFLVMWLVTAVSKDKRAAIFEYFKNPTSKSKHSEEESYSESNPESDPENLVEEFDLFLQLEPWTPLSPIPRTRNPILMSH